MWSTECGGPWKTQISFKSAFTQASLIAFKWKNKIRFCSAVIQTNQPSTHTSTHPHTHHRHTHPHTHPAPHSPLDLMFLRKSKAGSSLTGSQTVKVTHLQIFSLNATLQQRALRAKVVQCMPKHKEQQDQLQSWVCRHLEVKSFQAL